MGDIYKKRLILNGIEIVVDIKDDNYDVSITINPEVDVSKALKSKFFTLKFFLLNGEKSLKEPVHLEAVNKKYKKGCTNSNAILLFSSDNYYRCSISLSPKLYISDEKLNEAKAAQEEKKKEKRKRNKKQMHARYSTKNTYTPGISKSNITKYERNNANHPYSGGRVSPK